MGQFYSGASVLAYTPDALAIGSESIGTVAAAHFLLSDAPPPSTIAELSRGIRT